MDEEDIVLVSTSNTGIGYYVPSDVEELSQNRRNNQRINENLRSQSSVSQFEADYSLRDHELSAIIGLGQNITYTGMQIGI